MHNHNSSKTSMKSNSSSDKPSMPSSHPFPLSMDPAKPILAEEALDIYLRTSVDEKSELKQEIRQNFQIILTALRRRQLHGSHNCAKATLELLRKILGHGRYTTADHMMNIVRIVGKELVAAAPAEYTIGNIVRRILHIIREEQTQKLRLSARVSSSAGQVSNSHHHRPRTSITSTSDLSSSASSSIMSSAMMSSSTISSSSSIIKRERSNTSSSVESNQSIEKKLIIHDSLSSSTSSSTSSSASSSASSASSSPTRPRASSGLGLHINEQDYFEALLAAVDESSTSMKASIYNIGGNVLGTVGVNDRSISEHIDYSRHFSDMRQSVMSAVNELNDELDAIYGPISELAIDHIHADECILTYGHHMIVELFLKAAARKRKYQVIIVESSPNLDGVQLASNLAKISNISVTLIPDSGIYAIMSRVNKVIFAPQAVMADGGAIARCGHHLITTAAKDFTVPVLGIIGTFSLTPLFAHNQSEVLGTLLSPASSISYHLPLKYDHIDFMMPAYDYIAPEYVELYLTNNGCHLPSYVYRILPEYYHPADYEL